MWGAMSESLSGKGESPPLPVESLRSTKKVRIRSGVEGEEQVANEAGSDVLMLEEAVPEDLSYRDKLLNGSKGDDRRVTEVVVTEADYSIGREGEIPSIEFSKDVRDVLTKGMERTLVIKLLGRSIIYRDLVSRTQSLWQPKGSYQLIDMEKNFYLATFDLEEDYNRALTGGPWMVFGAYLTVQPWSLEFDCNNPRISKVVAWIRIPGLSFRYYHKSALRAIGTLLGEVVKIDYSTESRGRGKYARIAVIIDLEQPLTPWIKVDGRIYGVQYEGLPHICFECGKYGHTKEKCKGRIQSASQEQSQVQGISHHAATQANLSSSLPEAAKGTSPESGSPSFGAWMQVEDEAPRRTSENRSGVGSQVANIGAKFAPVVNNSQTRDATRPGVMGLKQPKCIGRKGNVRTISQSRNLGLVAWWKLALLGVLKV
ncbi:hypothetical protein K1719_020870 [Acacia pycnantha]|nr:hypothetical protein K1719_020870 [Acacia pycnantha]